LNQQQAKSSINDHDFVKQDVNEHLSSHSYSQADLNNILKALDESVIIAITDKDGTITYVNKKFCEISKYSENELLGQNHRILKSGHHTIEFYLAMWKTISSGNVWRGDIKNKAKDGSYYWVKTVIVPFLDEKGKICNYVAIRTNITKHKETESKLNQSLDFISQIKKFKNLYDNSPDLFRIVNIEGKIIYCNNIYASKLGYSSVADVIGHTIYDHVSEDNYFEIRNSFEAWKKEGNVINRKIMLMKKDGTEFPCLLSANSIYDEHDKLIGSNTIIKDMSDIFKAEKEIKQLKHEKLSILGQMAARLAHDIRNPLSVIKSSISIIEKHYSDNTEEKLQNSFTRMHNSISRISHQIEDVLEFLEIRGLEIQRTEISDILNSVSSVILIPPEIKLTVDRKYIELECDIKKIETVFINLILNAIQAIEKEGWIRISTLEQDGYVIINVEDTGPGIPPNVIDRVFDPLVTTKQTGTGLGLSSCKIIVEQHGGSISLKTNPTVFTVKLPKIVPSNLLESK